MSLVLEGSNMSIERDDQVDQARPARHASSGTSAPVDQPTLLNTGMTRDGLFLIENGEIAGPVQNFRWNMSPLVGYNNITAVGKPVPIHTGESYDGPRHGAGAAGPDRRLLHDVGVAGGLTTTCTSREVTAQTLVARRCRELGASCCGLERT